MSSHRDFNDVYGQVEQDYRENDGQEEQAMEEVWISHILANCNDIVQKYGIKYFINHLPTYTKIALAAHYRSLKDKPSQTWGVIECKNGDPF